MDGHAALRIDGGYLSCRPRHLPKRLVDEIGSLVLLSTGLQGKNGAESTGS
jgi:hypothetical protein